MRAHDVVFALMFLKGAFGAITEAVLSRDDMTEANKKTAVTYHNRAAALKRKMVAEFKKRREDERCDFSVVHVSTGLNIDEHEPMVQGGKQIKPHGAEVTFKCAHGFTATGEPDGAKEVRASCKDGAWTSTQRQQVGSSKDGFDIDAGDIVLGCMPIVCLDIAGGVGRKPAKWNPGDYLTEMGVKKHGQTELESVHGAIGTIECNKGFSSNGNRIKKELQEDPPPFGGYGARKLVVKCYMGQLYFANEVTFSKNHDEDVEGKLETSPDSAELQCKEIQRSWPPQKPSITPGEFIVPVENSWSWEVGFGFIFAFWDNPIGWVEDAHRHKFSCAAGYSQDPDHPEGPYNEYSVLIDADGVYTVEGLNNNKHTFDDETNIEDWVKENLCLPINCKPKDAGCDDDPQCSGIGAENWGNSEFFTFAVNAGGGKDLKCKDKYTFTGKEKKKEEDASKKLKCTTAGRWDGIEPCLSTACEGMTTKIITCPEGQSFTGKATMQEEAKSKTKKPCGGPTNAEGDQHLCKKTLKCDPSNHNGFFDEANTESYCKPGDKDDPCLCRPIECEKPKLDNLAVEIDTATLTYELTGVTEEGKAYYGSMIDLECVEGYSFFKQRFDCAAPDAKEPGSRLCHASYRCKETGLFERYQFCKTLPDLDPLSPSEGTTLTAVPYQCSKIEDYCPPLTGTDAEPDPKAGGGYPGIAVFDCSKFTQLVKYSEVTEITPLVGAKPPQRTCLGGSEELACTHDGWEFNGATVAKYGNEAWKDQDGTTAGTHVVEEVGKKCMANDHLMFCDDVAPNGEDAIVEWATIQYNRGQITNGFGNIKSDVKYRCGDVLAWQCDEEEDFIPSTLNGKKDNWIVFECGQRKKGEPAQWWRVEQDADKNLVFTEKFEKNKFECKVDEEEAVDHCAEGVQKSAWYAAHAAFYESLFTAENIPAIKSAAFTCRQPSPPLSRAKCLVDRKAILKKLSVHPWNQATVNLQCNQETGYDPLPQAFIDACGFQIQNGQALQISSAKDSVSVQKADKWVPEQRWALWKTAKGFFVVSAHESTVDSGKVSSRTKRGSDLKNMKCLGVANFATCVEEWAKCARPKGKAWEGCDATDASCALAVRDCGTMDEEGESSSNWDMADCNDDLASNADRDWQCGLSLKDMIIKLRTSDVSLDIPPRFYLDLQKQGGPGITVVKKSSTSVDKFSKAEGVPVLRLEPEPEK